MMISIYWAEQHNKVEKWIEIPVGFACLRVCHNENIVIKSEWCLDYAVTADEESRLYLQLKNYLNNPVCDLTINLQEQGSAFRRKVWAEICKIPAGQVQSYSELANNIGSGARAVANACRDNAYPGIIPCHRVVSVNGLGGFMGATAGEYIEIKRKLLALEKSATDLRRGSVGSGGFELFEQSEFSNPPENLHCPVLNR